MGALRKEWTEEEILNLDKDLKIAKAEVLSKHGFTVKEIGKLMDIPEAIILHMLG